jgi:hypothetical protein
MLNGDGWKTVFSANTKKGCSAINTTESSFDDEMDTEEKIVTKNDKNRIQCLLAKSM